MPFTAAGDVVLIRSYRYAVDAWSWELPAGGLGSKPGLSLDDVAREELLEETGYKVGGQLEMVYHHLDAIGNSRMPGYVFVATDVEKVADQDLDATEAIEVHEMTLDEAVGLIDRGEMQDAASAVALLFVARRNQWGQSRLFTPDVGSSTEQGD